MKFIDVKKSVSDKRKYKTYQDCIQINYEMYI